MSVEILKTNKDWLIWARKSLNYDIESVARKLKVSEDTVTQWESTGELTNEDLDALSELYHQNPAIFFNLNPPGEIETITDYRDKINEKITLNPEILLEIRKSKNRRQNLLDIELEDPTLENPDFIFKDFEYKNSIDSGEEIRKILEISKAKIERYSINDWITIIENLGILVFQFYNLKVEVLRGYSIYYDKLPIIAINHRESNNAKKFTLVHELSHLILKKEGLTNLQTYDIENESEYLSTELASEILVPEHLLKELVKDEDKEFYNEETISKYAKKLHTTEEVIVRRFLSLNYISKEEYGKYFNELNQYINPKKVKKVKEEKEVKTKPTNTPSFNPDNTFKRQASQKITENGKYYLSHLFRAYENNVISELDLSNNLDADLRIVNFIKNKYYKV